jgi:hypothetical protein
MLLGMKMDRIEFGDDGRPKWAGMSDYALVSPDRRHEIILRYVDEPPHGDSYHRAWIDGRAFPGFFWGAYFGFTPDSRFFAGSWMSDLYDRQTTVVDLFEQRYLVLPDHIPQFVFDWPKLTNVCDSAGSAEFQFSDGEHWVPY